MGRSCPKKTVIKWLSTRSKKLGEGNTEGTDLDGWMDGWMDGVLEDIKRVYITYWWMVARLKEL